MFFCFFVFFLRPWFSARTILSWKDFCWFDLRLVRQHSVKVDLEVSKTFMTSALKETAYISCTTALLLRVHYWARPLLGLISDTASWHHCDTFCSCFWTAVTAVWVCHWLFCRYSRRLSLSHCCSDPVVPVCSQSRGLVKGKSLVPVSVGDRYFTGCCCVLSCGRQANAILYKFQQQFELHSLFRSIAMVRVSSFLWNLW